MNALRRSFEPLSSVSPMRKQAPCTRPLTGCEGLPWLAVGPRCVKVENCRALF